MIFDPWGYNADELRTKYRLTWVYYWPELFGAAFRFAVPAVMLVAHEGAYSLSIPPLVKRKLLYQVLPRRHVEYRGPMVEGQPTRWGLQAVLTEKPLIHPCGDRLMYEEELAAIYATDKSLDWFSKPNGCDVGFTVNDDSSVTMNYTGGQDEKIIDLTKHRMPYNIDPTLPRWTLE